MALPLVALTVLHASVFAVTMLTAATWLPWLIIGLPAGAWVDRLPRRRVMMCADLVTLAAFASVTRSAALGRLTVAQLVVVALVAGTATVFFATAYRAFLPALVDGDDLLEGNAKLQGSQQVARIAGPGTAGQAGGLASHLGVRPTLWIMLTGLIASSFVLLTGPLRKLRDLPASAGWQNARTDPA